MIFTHAITRRPSPDFASGLTAVRPKTAPDYHLLLKQHRRYIAALVDLGLEVVELPELAQYPDAYFVEDVAVVTGEIAVITNPGAPSRRGEADFIVFDISRFRETRRISDPGRLDGGDVLQVENHFFIGLSERTNLPGAEQLGGFLEECGHTWSTVPVGAGMHLKSSINYLGENTLVATEEMGGDDRFSNFNLIRVPPQEAYAANTLAVNGHLLTPAGFPRTRAALESLGMPVTALDVSEVAKMDGGLTCLSLRFG